MVKGGKDNHILSPSWDQFTSAYVWGWWSIVLACPGQITRSRVIGHIGVKSCKRCYWAGINPLMNLVVYTTAIWIPHRISFVTFQEKSSLSALSGGIIGFHWHSFAQEDGDDQRVAQNPNIKCLMLSWREKGGFWAAFSTKGDCKLRFTAAPPDS